MGSGEEGERGRSEKVFTMVVKTELSPRLEASGQVSWVGAHVTGIEG